MQLHAAILPPVATVLIREGDSRHLGHGLMRVEYYYTLAGTTSSRSTMLLATSLPLASPIHRRLALDDRLEWDMYHGTDGS